jgi:hypothetical protein
VAEAAPASTPAPSSASPRACGRTSAPSGPITPGRCTSGSPRRVAPHHRPVRVGNFHLEEDVSAGRRAGISSHAPPVHLSHGDRGPAWTGTEAPAPAALEPPQAPAPAAARTTRGARGSREPSAVRVRSAGPFTASSSLPGVRADAHRRGHRPSRRPRRLTAGSFAQPGNGPTGGKRVSDREPAWWRWRSAPPCRPGRRVPSAR